MTRLACLRVSTDARCNDGNPNPDDEARNASDEVPKRNVAAPNSNDAPIWCIIQLPMFNVQVPNLSVQVLKSNDALIWCIVEVLSLNVEVPNSNDEVLKSNDAPIWCIVAVLMLNVQVPNSNVAARK